MSANDGLGSKLTDSQNKVEAFQVMQLSASGILHQAVAFGGVSVDSDAFEQGTSILELFPTQDCWVRLVPVGTSAAAAKPADAHKHESVFCPGGITKFFGLPLVKNTTWKLAVIKDATSGTLHITEGAS